MSLFPARVAMTEARRVGQASVSGRKSTLVQTQRELLLVLLLRMAGEWRRGKRRREGENERREGRRKGENEVREGRRREERGKKAGRRERIT